MVQMIISTPQLAERLPAVVWNYEEVKAGVERALAQYKDRVYTADMIGSAKADRAGLNKLADAIAATPFATPCCPVYQNVDALPHTNPEEIKSNLIAQLTAAVRWSYSVEHMIADGATEFIEVGPGSVLQGMIKKINKEVLTSGRQ